MNIKNKGTVSQMFKIIVKCATDRHSRNSQSSVHNLRNTSNDLKLSLIKSATGQRYFSFRGVKSWNSLSVESKKAVNLVSFEASI